MKKITKHIITITVYILIILYFLIIFNKDIFSNKNKICKNFDILLSSKIEQYFANSLPERDGVTSEVSVGDLIAKGYLTLSDLKDVGTTCSGSAYISKVEDKYYYYNNITCGTCSIDSIYTAWSDWTEELPNFGGKNAQVMTKILYNYSNSDKKYSDWSDWGEDIAKIKAPTIPSGATEVDKEIEEKTQYRYRDAQYQWYKISSTAVYYNNGAYFETAPASGYTKDDSTKTISKQSGLYRTKAELKQKEPGFSDDSIKAVKGYAQKVAKYIYSYVQLGDAVTSMYFADSASAAISKCQVDGYTNCKAVSTTETQYSKSEYQCSASSYGWGAATNTSVTSCTASSPTCSSSSDVGNQKVTCQATAWTPTISTCQSTYAYTDDVTSGTAWIKTNGSCYGSSGICSSLNSGMRSALASAKWCVDYSPSCSSASDAGNQKLTSCKVAKSYCSKASGGTCYSPMRMSDSGATCYIFISSPAQGYLCRYNGKTYGTINRLNFELSYQTCQSTYANVVSTGSQVTSCTATSAPTCSSSNAGASTITKCTASKYTKSVQTCGTNGYTRSTTPIKTTIVSSCTPSANQTCTSTASIITCSPSLKTVYGYTGNEASKTYYLKSDGTTTTNQSQASYLLENEYNVLKTKNSDLSKYKKTGNPIYDSSNSVLVEGTCPSGNYECLTLYKAITYKYKWYKDTVTSKTWCNNKSYSSTSPGNGCIKDEDSAKWGEWSKYQDKEPSESDSRQIETNKTVRYRIVYTNTNSLELSDWLLLSEFEEKMGTTVEALKKQSNITVWEKVLYKYRLKK